MNCPRKTLVLALAVGMVLPQAAVPQEDVRARLREAAELVLLPVAVKDREGNLVADLQRGEFRVLEDGVEQQLALFLAEPFPLSAVVLIDNGLPVKLADQLQRSVGAIAGAFAPSDEVAVALFEAFFQPVLEFTSDNDKLYQQLKRLNFATAFPGQGSGPMTGGPRVGTGPKTSTRWPAPERPTKNLDDAVHAAAQLLRNRPRDHRKIILIVSDGLNSRNNAVRTDDVLKQLLSADISVYAIAVGARLQEPATRLLTRYARATGGDIFDAGGRAELESLYGRAAEQARNQYTLAYLPTGTDRKRLYHEIEVRVRRPNLAVLAREGYFVVPAR